MKQPQVNVRLVNSVYWLLLIVVVLVFLYVGRNLLIPLVVALFIWYLVNVIAISYSSFSVFGKRLPKWLAFILSGTTILLLTQGLVNLITGNVYQVVEAAPQYQENLVRQFRALLENFSIEHSQALTEYFANLELGGMLAMLVKSMANLIGNLGLISIYLLLLFIEQPYFMKKIERALMGNQGHDDVLAVFQAIDADIRTYIGVKTFTSFLTAAISFVILSWTGLDFAELWAVLIFVLNFIPNIGSIVATILPSLLALVQFEPLTPFLVIFFGIGATQIVIGNILDPNLMGHRLNISPLVIVLSMLLWGYLWGVPGLFLGVPMMVILMIVLYHFEDTRWVAVLLSRDGRLRE
ncbi:AI-2E family transporter [Methylobacter marinus]|uniref:AI-2E family transporter n=1 Tax=Methylobacter marinus TaxID=34058 RepID=UPI00035C0B53|nr:AI-2E family transporter [Methylobacter marinus]